VPEESKKRRVTGCESTASFLNVSKLKQHLTSSVHTMDNKQAQKLAESTFGKTMGKLRKRGQADT